MRDGRSRITLSLRGTPSHTCAMGTPHAGYDPVPFVTAFAEFSTAAPARKPMAPRRPPALDRIDVKILAQLQAHGRSTIQKLADEVGLSPRPCLERVRRLEAAGIIIGYRAVLDIERLARPVTVFAEIAL